MKRRNILSIFLCVMMVAAVFATVAVVKNVVAERSITEKIIEDLDKKTDSSFTVINLERDLSQIDGTAYASITIYPIETDSQMTDEEKSDAMVIDIAFVLLMIVAILGIGLVYIKLKKRGNKLERMLSIGFMFMLIATFFAMAVPMNVSATDPYPGTPNHYVDPGSLYPGEPYITWETAAHSIQPAIDVAWDGDMVHVAEEIYYENVVIDRPVTLTGKDKNTTVIDGGGDFSVIFLSTNDAVVNGFTVRNGHYGGIYISGGGNIISNNIISDNGKGICGEDSVNNIISDNIISNNTPGIDLCRSTNYIISDNDISNNEYGISLYYSSNNTISRNNISNNLEDGIILYNNPMSNTISGNTISGNSHYGIKVSWSNNQTIFENIISNNLYGLYVTISSNNLIYHNNISDNTYQAYDDQNDNQWDNDYPSGGNYWSDYTGSDGDGDGIGDTPYIIDADSQDRYPLMNPWLRVHNIDKDWWYHDIQPAIDEADIGDTIEAGSGDYYENVVIDRPVTLTGKDKNTTVIDGGGDFSVIFLSTNDAVVNGFTVRNGHYGGIYISGGGNIISNNIISDNGKGICGEDSVNNTIIDNIISNNTTGIALCRTTNINIINNDISYNEYGITLYYARNNTISYNRIEYNDYGIYLTHWSSTNTISLNHITFSTEIAIWVDFSDCNFIFDNHWIAWNRLGIYLWWSSNNLIYHNNFVFLSHDYGAYEGGLSNYWDNGWPTAGNWWEDYDGVDYFQGPNQDIPGSDGIGDTPYTNIHGDTGAIDHYPLIDWDYPDKPWMRVQNLDTGLWYHYIQDAVDEAKFGEYLYATESIYYENVDISGQDKKHVVLMGENRYNTIIDGRGGQHQSTVLIHDTSYIWVRDFTIRGGGPTWWYEDAGLKFYNTQNCGVQDCIISNNELYGIYGAFSDNIRIWWTDISFNTGLGIELHNCTNTKILNCWVHDNGGGIYFYANIDPSADQFIQDSRVYNNLGGGITWIEAKCIVTNNHVYGNGGGGIRSRTSSGSEISGNFIKENGYDYVGYREGIILIESSLTHIYHNDIIDNDIQASDDRGDNYWDNGYPSGGNYWSDYTGSDGDGDGIGDTPYYIDGDSVDYYPLMNPIT